jgi:predicted secreted protein
MPSEAISGVGAVFQRNGVAIAEVNSISGPNRSRDVIDVTSLDSTGGYREFIGSFRDGGEVSLEMNWTSTGYGLMLADFESNTLQTYQIVLPDDGNYTLEFSGLVSDLELNVPMDDKITANVTIKISGDVTETS